MISKRTLFFALLVLFLATTNLVAASWFGGDSHKEVIAKRIKEWQDGKKTSSELFSSIYKEAAKKAQESVNQLKQEGKWEQSRDKIADIWNKAIEEAKTTARDVRIQAENMPENAERGLGAAAAHMQALYTEEMDAAKTRAMELKERTKEIWEKARARLGDLWTAAAGKADQTAEEFAGTQRKAAHSYESLRTGISDAYSAAVENAKRRFEELKQKADDTDDTVSEQASAIWKKAMEEAQAEIDKVKAKAKNSKLEDFAEAFNRALRGVKDKWADMKEERPFETLKEKLASGYDTALTEAEKGISWMRAQPKEVLSAADSAQLAFADSTREAISSAKKKLTELKHSAGESYEATKDRMWDVYEKAWEAAAPPPRPKTFAEKAWENIRRTFSKGAEMLTHMPHPTEGLIL